MGSNGHQMSALANKDPIQLQRASRNIATASHYMHQQSRCVDCVSDPPANAPEIIYQPWKGHAVIRIARGWTWKCETCETRIKCLRKSPKHLTLTHTHYTHTTTISVQEFGAFDIEKYHLCLKSRLFHFIMGFMYLITSVVLRLYKWLDTLGVMYKSSMEWSLSFWDFSFRF